MKALPALFLFVCVLGLVVTALSSCTVSAQAEGNLKCSAPNYRGSPTVLGCGFTMDCDAASQLASLNLPWKCDCACYFTSDPSNNVDLLCSFTSSTATPQ